MKRILALGLGVLLAGLLGCSVILPNEIAAASEEEQLTPPAAVLTNPDIAIAVRYDYDDRVRAGVTVPAFVDVTNTGPAIDGVLRLSITPQNSLTALCYEMPVYVDGGEASSFALPFLTQSEVGNIRVHLILNGEPVAEAEHARNYVVYTSEMLVGVLSADPNGLAYRFNGVSLMDDDGARLTTVQVDLSSGDFPDEAYMLERFSLVVLNNYDLGLLSEAQREALFAWVRRGGRLLADADPQGAQALRSLAPLVNVDGTGAAVAFDGDEPAVREYPVGGGKVFATVFALGDPQIHQNGSFAGILRDIRGLSAIREAERPDRGAYYSYGGASSYLQDAVRSIEWLDAPSVSWILAMLLGFIIVAAPVSYIVLRKKDKRDLIWFTAPALSLVCCAVIIGYGTARHGVDAVSSVVTVIDSRAGAHAGHNYSAVGVAAPRQNTYKIGVKEDGAFPFRYNENYYYNDDGTVAPAGRPAVLIDTSGQPLVTFDNIRQWSMDSFYLLRDLELAGRLETEVNYSGGTAFCVVKNNTGYDLEDVTVVTQAGYLRLPLLENGGEGTGTATPYEYTSGYATMPSSYRGIEYWNVIQELYGGPTVLPGYISGRNGDARTVGEKREDYLKAQMVNALLETAQLQRYQSRYTGVGAMYGNDGSSVWGWSGQAGALDITANGKGTRNELNRAVIFGDAKISYEIDGEMHSLLGQITGITVDASDLGMGIPLGDSYTSFSKGDVTFAFDLSGTAKSGDVSGMSLSSYNARGDFTVALLNNSTGEWDMWGDGMTLATGIEISLNPGYYVGEDGRVLMKLTAGHLYKSEEDGDVPADKDPYYEGDVVIDSVVLSVLGRGR